MKAYTSYVAMVILAAVVTLSVLPSVLAQGFYDEEACPDCGGEDIYTKQNLAKQNITPILVWTDNSVYDHNSKIMVEGTVATVKPGTEIGLKVIGPPPFNNVIAVDQLSIGSDGKFSTVLNTAGNPWKYDGTYTIKVTYGTQEINNSVKFQLTGGILGTGTPVACGANELSASGQCIPYSISGGTVTGARINVATTSLIVNINAIDDGTITLEIPRRVLDTDSSFDPFFVLVDGEEVRDVDEKVSSTTRTLTIMFHAGADEIEVIGTFAIPEFGTIAALVLIVAIVSIIAITSRTKLKILPKY